MKTKQQKILFLLFIMYTALILYFMFLGFYSTRDVAGGNYRFNLEPSGIPLKFPTTMDLSNFNLW